MNPMMLMALLGGMGGTSQEKPKSPYAGAIDQTFPAMTAGGATPNADLLQSPLFAASAYRDTSNWGTQTPDASVPADSLLRVGQRARQGPAGMSGWEKFGAFLKNMPTEDRLMLGMSGLDGLLRTLSGKL